MPSTHTFVVNGKRVRVQVEDNVRLLWVLRDLLGIHGPKYGCGLNVCKACTSHINGKAFNPCAVPMSQIKADDHITTIEGLPATVHKDLHPMQQAWLDHDVAQCGFCQPGQIMAAVALVEEVHASGRNITEADLDGIRNVCRCGTYYRVRAAVVAGAAAMSKPVTPVKGDGPVATPLTPAPPGTLPTTGASTSATVVGAAAIAAAAGVAAHLRSTGDDAEDLA
jgi:isoquinoline 1-oxidoreductase alpha subunit